MIIPEFNYPEEKAFDLDDFRDMDYYAVKNYDLPIELMMENAGLQLANLTASLIEKHQVVKIGIGNGNNGGGGLVAARRLAAWGYSIYLDTFTDITKELPTKQLERALKFGVKTDIITKPDLWIDAYLGFSQRLPLSQSLLAKIEEANSCNSIKISLDIPTGFLGDLKSPHFHANKILSLAAPKKILYRLSLENEVFIADLGIPVEVYKQFGRTIPPFHIGNLLKLKR